MTALESIIEWAESDLPDWQSDAVRRLLVQDSLTDEDRQDILSMLKSIHSLLPARTTPSKPLPLQKGMVSGAPESKAEVILKMVKDLRNVNKIPDGSALPFGHQGLTVIYGENGSGKSGYARVLKRACRARDTQERILPDVYGSATRTPAKATFKLSINAGPNQEIEWEDGKESDEILTNITVFDSKCARVIIDEKNEATYLPYGTHVFEELVNLLNWIGQEIEAEKPNPEPLQLSDISLVTKPGIFLTRLTHETDKKEVEEAFTWTDDDADKLVRFTKQITYLEANDPIKQASTTRSFKERVTNLRAYIEKRIIAFSDKRLTEFKEMIAVTAEAEKAVGLASQAALRDEPLSGAGENAWQMLYNAAKDYSTKVAYPDNDFPVVSNESRCVFCMQPLSDDAKQRLLRFNNFMEQSAKKKHEVAKRSLDSTFETIEALKSTTTADQHTNTISEVRQRDEGIAVVVASYLASIGSRLKYCDRLMAGNEMGELPLLPTSPISILTQFIDALEMEAQDLEEAADTSERARIKNKKAELLAQKCFVDNRAKILAYLTDLKNAHKCDIAKAATHTTTITRKGKNIVSEALTPQLRCAIQSELKLLGAANLPLNLKPSGSRGETLHQFELKGAMADRKINLSDVLSEGEQRVVALAGFFAEVGLGQHSCPIILDDPVSSLDHRFRARIAIRLVSESKKRQVIIFTHNIAFLLALQEKAGELDGVYFTAQTVIQHNETAGILNEGLPWHAMPVKARLKYLRTLRDEIKALHGTDHLKYNKETAFLYALLRETWEAAIEEVVFNKTIVRHGNEVQTLRLKNVSVTTNQYRTIDINMSKCSKWMLGHDKSKELDIHRPDPSEILVDIDALNAFVKESKKAGETLREERDAALKPESSQIG